LNVTENPKRANKIMNILVLGSMYEPDLGPSAPLYTMLCKGLVKLGHQVTVIAPVPHYPTGQVSKAYRGKWLWRSVESGVNILRVGLPSVNRAKLAQRFFQYGCDQLITTLVGWRLKYDVVLAVNPFLTVGLPFAVLGALRRKPIVYSVQDLYPDVGIALGIFKNKFVIETVAFFERYCLQRSTIIQIISNSFRPSLRGLGVPDEKMALVYNWVDTELIHPVSRTNSFAQENNLIDRFVVLYAGNIGLSQGLEGILDSAEQLSSHDKLLFLFVGDGAGRGRLMAEAKKRKLKNVKFLPFQPRERLVEVLASADISLVTLRSGLGVNSVPSKALSNMASGRPLIVSVDEANELSNLVKQADMGLWIPPEDPAALSQAIMKLMQDKGLCERLGHNGRTWAEHNHSPEVAAKKYEELLLQALTSKGK
jgi:colanic acid biosynthesis glycosyl transferase WcaI